MSERSRLCQKRPWLVGKRFFGLRACQGLRPCQKDQDHVREVETMSERSRPCQKGQDHVRKDNGLQVRGFLV